MKLFIVGMGRVGSSLASLIINHPKLDELALYSHREQIAEACKMQIASANPELIAKVSIASSLDGLATADIIVITSGLQMKKGERPEDVKKRNTLISWEIIQGRRFKTSAIIICLATPVDDITAFVASQVNLPTEQVIGFGGDLDKNRLMSVLLHRGHNVDNTHVIGEHGARVIPVYPGERDYDSVALAVRNYLFELTKKVGSAPNLSTGILLARLIDTILNDREQIHYVSTYHEEWSQFLTWPSRVGRAGVMQLLPVPLGPQAERNLALLLARKHQEKHMPTQFVSRLFPRASRTCPVPNQTPRAFSLMAIDVQHDFASEGGKKYNPARKPVVDFIRGTVIPFCETHGIKVAEIISDDRLPRKCETKEYCVPGTHGYLSVLPDAVKYSIWIKAMYSPEWVRKNIGSGHLPTDEPYIDSKAFDAWLDKTIGNPDMAGEVILFGLTLDCCVLYTALALHFRGYRIKILSEAVDTADSRVETKEQILAGPILNKLANRITWSEFKQLAVASSHSNSYVAKL